MSESVADLAQGHGPEWGRQIERGCRAAAFLAMHVGCRVD
jgi:hypothetical protein